MFFLTSLFPGIFAIVQQLQICSEIEDRWKGISAAATVNETDCRLN